MSFILPACPMILVSAHASPSAQNFHAQLSLLVPFHPWRPCLHTVLARGLRTLPRLCQKPLPDPPRAPCLCSWNIHHIYKYFSIVSGGNRGTGVFPVSSDGGVCPLCCTEVAGAVWGLLASLWPTWQQELGLQCWVCVMCPALLTTDTIAGCPRNVVSSFHPSVLANALALWGLSLQACVVLLFPGDSASVDGTSHQCAGRAAGVAWGGDSKGTAVCLWRGLLVIAAAAKSLQPCPTLCDP